MYGFKLEKGIQFVKVTLKGLVNGLPPLNHKDLQVCCNQVM